MPATHSIAHVDDIHRQKAPRSGTAFANLTEELGCTEIAIRVWTLHPGDSITYHRETSQEELYYPMSGGGKMRIENKVIGIPEGAIVRVPPETARNVFNDTQGTQKWLIIGAPKNENEAKYLEM
jgi:uncharacterized cupin superfamily protein